MKHINFLCVFIFGILLTAIHCLVVPIFYEKIEMCANDDEKAGFIDESDFKIHIENDTHSFANGTWKFLNDISSPWAYTMFTERYTRGQWIIEVFNRKIPDMCPELHNKLQPWYYFYKDVTGCPIQAGTQWDFNMIHLELPSAITPNFVGKWRFTQISEYLVNGIIKKDCNRIYLDLFEE